MTLRYVKSTLNEVFLLLKMIQAKNIAQWKVTHALGSIPRITKNNNYNYFNKVIICLKSNSYDLVKDPPKHNLGQQLELAEFSIGDL